MILRSGRGPSTTLLTPLRRACSSTTACLRAEIAAPYKNNVIGGIVLGVGVLAVVFAQFPQLLELNAPGSIASFPAEL